MVVVAPPALRVASSSRPRLSIQRRPTRVLLLFGNPFFQTASQRNRRKNMGIGGYSSGVLTSSQQQQINKQRIEKVPNLNNHEHRHEENKKPSSPSFMDVPLMGGSLLGAVSAVAQSLTGRMTPTPPASRSTAVTAAKQELAALYAEMQKAESEMREMSQQIASSKQRGKDQLAQMRADLAGLKETRRRNEEHVVPAVQVLNNASRYEEPRAPCPFVDQHDFPELAVRGVGGTRVVLPLEQQDGTSSSSSELPPLMTRAQYKAEGWDGSQQASHASK